MQISTIIAIAISVRYILPHFITDTRMNKFTRIQQLCQTETMLAFQFMKKDRKIFPVEYTILIELTNLIYFVETRKINARGIRLSKIKRPESEWMKRKEHEFICRTIRVGSLYTHCRLSREKKRLLNRETPLNRLCNITPLLPEQKLYLYSHAQYEKY